MCPHPWVASHPWLAILVDNSPHSSGPPAPAKSGSSIAEISLLKPYLPAGSHSLEESFKVVIGAHPNTSEVTRLSIAAKHRLVQPVLSRFALRLMHIFETSFLLALASFCVDIRRQTSWTNGDPSILRKELIQWPVHSIPRRTQGGIAYCGHLTEQ